MGMMYSCYRGLSRTLAPFIRSYFYCRCWFGKDEKQSVRNHFGEPTAIRPIGRLIWIHAASIGEANSAITYIRHLKESHPHINVLITTVTLTSANMLRNKIKTIQGCCYQFAIADVPHWISRFLDFWRPEMAIFLESEIWPNVIYELRERNIPMFLLNARLSDKSFRRWKRFSSCMRSLLENFNAVLAQSKKDADKFQSFGTENVFQIDNLKYANSVLPCNNDVLEVFRSFCSGRYVFVAASTHQGEEEIILQAHILMNKKFPVTTVIIPRHVDRIRQIKSICTKFGVKYTLKSEAINGRLGNSDVFIVDSYGEVGTFYQLAHVTFVGGSLVNVGGHNILEPAAVGKIVLHGPYMSNFSEIMEDLHGLSVAYEVKSSDDICSTCLKMFENTKCLEHVRNSIPDKVKNKSLEQIDNFIIAKLDENL